MARVTTCLTPTRYRYIDQLALTSRALGLGAWDFVM